MSSPAPPLSQGAGYGVIIGLGAFFAVVVVGLSQSLRKFGGLAQSSSEYSVASRSLGVGLTAAGAVSAWCWSVTLLSSVTTAYQQGLAGALVYGGGNMSQVALFSLFAVQLKRRAPHLHTHLELLKIRYGTLGHLTFLFFALATNVLVVSSILVGSAASINSITGVNVYASLFLLPVAVAAYTLQGGLRSTILADYLHTLVIFIILFVFFFVTYATGKEIGSPSRMYDLLTLAAERNPSSNYAGSWVTVKSLGSIKFGWLSFLEYTATFINDASAHQKGIAANPSAAVPGYIIGSLSWFSIPWTLATTAGLVALALEQTSPNFPTYPNRMSEKEVSAGLALPYAAQALLGKGGSAGVLLLMFMSSTSAISAQLIAVSSISGYDLYSSYINTKATPNQILRVQQWAVIGFALFMAAFASLLHGVNVDLGFLYNIVGVASTGSLPALTFSFFGDRLPTWAVFPGIWVGFGAGLAVWFSLAKRLVGEISLTALKDTEVDLYVYTTCIGTGILLCTIGSLFNPQYFDWSSLRNHQRGDTTEAKEVAAIENDERFQDKYLKKWLIIAGVLTTIIFVVFMLIWPLSLYRDYVFTKSFFTGWIVVSGIWSFLAFFAVGIYPLVEGFPAIRLVFKGIIAYLQGQRDAPVQDEVLQHDHQVQEKVSQFESNKPASDGSESPTDTPDSENGSSKKINSD